MADLGYPLYGLTFGQSRGLGQSRDVAVKEMTVNQTVFVKNQLTVFGSVRIDGYPNQEVPVQLLFESPGGKMEVVASKKLLHNKEGEALPVEMSYVPQTPGEYKVTLRVAKQPGELVTTNNELSSYVTVLKGGLSATVCRGLAAGRAKVLATFARCLARHQGRLRPPGRARSERSSRRPRREVSQRQV